MKKTLVMIILFILCICSFFNIKSDAETAGVNANIIIDLKNSNHNDNIELLYILEKSNYNKVGDQFNSYDGIFNYEGITYHYNKIDYRIENNGKKTRLISSNITGSGLVTFAIRINNNIISIEGIGWGQKQDIHYSLDCETNELIRIQNRSILNIITDEFVSIFSMLIITIFIKIGLAKIFKFENNKKVFAINLLTQTMLAIFLFLIVTYNLKSYLIVIAMITITLIEIMLYKSTFKCKQTVKKINNNYIEYTLLGNTISYIISFIITMFIMAR